MKCLAACLGVGLALLLHGAAWPQESPLARRVLDQVAAQGGAYPLPKASLTYYVVPAMSPVKRLPDSFPEDGDLCGALRIVAARGEFEPASFLIFAFASTDRAELKAAPLVGAGAVIPAEALDLKVVKCWYQSGTAWYSYFADPRGRVLVPELLLNDETLLRVDGATKDNYLRADYPTGPEYLWISNPQSVNVPYNAETEPVADARTLQPFALKAGEFKQFWVTVKTPADAAPGIYRGRIDILIAGAKVASVPLSMRVLPFSLPDPKTSYDLGREFYTMLYNDPDYLDILRDNGGDWNHADRKMLALYGNMRDHNIRHPRVPDYPATSRDPYFQSHGRNAFIRNLELLRQAGLATDTFFGSVPGIPPYDWMTAPAMQNTALRDQKLPEALIKRVDAAREVISTLFGHTNVYCFGWDEPSRRLVVAERAPWKYLHDHGLRVYSTATDAHLTFSGYNEDFVNCPGVISRERADRWHALGARITNYASPHTGPENPDFMRRVHGLQLYKANYDGVGNYILRCMDWNDFLGETHNFRGFNMTYPTRDGVIDTLAWEGVREAVDDVRYATLLKQLAAAAIATGRAESIYAGRRALQWLELLDEKSADLNTARLEMVNRVLELAAHVEYPKTPSRPAPVKASALPDPLPAPRPSESVENCRAVLTRERVTAREYRASFFKLIDLLAREGRREDARIAATQAGGDAKLAPADQFQARLVGAAFAPDATPEAFRTEAGKMAGAFADGQLTAEAKAAALQGAGKTAMLARLYPIARECAALVSEMYRKDPPKVYACRFVDKAPASVEGWQISPLLASPETRESRFTNYDRKAAELLVNDVNAVRAVGQEDVAADKRTSFAMSADADGWRIYVECADAGAERVSAGLLGGGQLEMFFAPGYGQCYYQWFVGIPKADFRTANWSGPWRHFRSLDGLARIETGEVKGGFAAVTFIPWEAIYDRLPVEGASWPFNVIRWTRAGGVTWSGKVHNIHDFGMVRWEGLTPRTPDRGEAQDRPQGLRQLPQGQE